MEKQQLAVRGWDGVKWNQPRFYSYKKPEANSHDQNPDPRWSASYRCYPLWHYSLFSQETAVTPESHEPTSFNCMPSEGGWATFAQRGTAISTVPMIAWNTTEFGNDYTPDERCRIVSQRFTIAVADNGGKLSHLDLTTGMLNNYAVVCFVLNRSSTCNDSNLLFTLKQENAQNPRLVLAKLTNFGRGKAGSDVTVYEKEPPQFISLEKLVNDTLPPDTGTSW